MRHARRVGIAVWAVCLGGCLSTGPVYVPPPDGAVPRELSKVTLPPYVIEPPDILQIDVLLPPEPGKDAAAPPKYSTALPPQPISGQHLVRPDGTVGLGIYGSVQVSGLTMDQARERIREFVSQQANKDPKALQVAVDVIAYNSKVYYVISDGAGFGEQVAAFPIVGSETVLDALGRVGGIPAVGSKRHIWVARRSPYPNCPDQILPVDWCNIAQAGATNTNYQVLPGDRIYVKAQPLISIDNALAKLFSPVERIFGVVLLGTSTVNQISNPNNGNFNNFGTANLR